MTFWSEIAATWREFQAGPKKTKRRKAWRPNTKFAPDWELPKQTVSTPRQVLSSPKLKTQHLKVIKAKLPISKPEPKEASWNDVIDTPQDRVERITTPAIAQKIRKNRRFYQHDMAKAQKHLLFMGPGDSAIDQAAQSLASGSALPLWATPFASHLTLRKGRLLFDNMPMLRSQEKRNAVKRLYFNPKEPTGIQPICDELRKKYANVSKGDVTRILRSLETYQLNFGRRLPPKVLGKMSLKQPGMIAIDMFFPSAQLGWMKTGGCLACMDCWSRYMRVFVLDSKAYNVVLKALTEYLAEFASFGFPPRRILCDKGSDLASAKEAIEKYRTQKDGNQPMVLKSVTGGPVNIIESLNAQIQRNMQVFRTSNLTDDPSVIAKDISFSINHQKRPDRGNLTPVQLLSLNKEERAQVNAMHEDRTTISPNGLKPIPVGATVRILMMTRKQQVSGMGGKYKGFAPKWSKDTFVVLKRTRLGKNHEVFRYFVDSTRSYYRHEILLVPKVVDTVVPDQYIRHKQEIVTVDEWDSD
jgi:hypothetical protein